MLVRRFIVGLAIRSSLICGIPFGHLLILMIVFGSLKGF